MNLPWALHVMESRMRRAKRLVAHGSPQAKGYEEYIAHLRCVDTDLPRGVVNLTVDLELGCGRSKGTTERAEVCRGRTAREVLPEFLRLTETYAIPVTFAVCGHLFLNECAEGSHYVPSPEAYGRSDSLPHRWGRAEENPLIHAPDLVERILESRGAQHEIASHGFLHVNFGVCDEAIARQELEAFAHAGSRYSVKATTFIFPDNRPGHLDLLKESGYEAYRSDALGPIGLDGHGLLRIPVGLWLSPFVATEDELAALLALARDRRAFVHLWLHLAEFKYGPEQLTHCLSPLFRILQEGRETGALELRTLAEVNALWRSLRGA